jgi:dTDP-4-amino-4,6-dideoxygalactose transaminase
MITVTKASLPDLDEYVKYLKRLWSTRMVTNNSELALLLEKRLEGYLRCRDLILVSNGTSALHLALRALDLKGEVITTPFTFIATTNVILWEGLTPVFADIDPETFNIDPSKVEAAITDKTSAILAVHVYGNPCYVEELQEIADKHDLKLIYDGAHSFGVEYNGKPIADYGDITTLSFHATKVFNTVEGGAIVTNHDGLDEKLRLLRDHGIKSEEEIAAVGTNAKMNEFQAAMGLCNLEHIEDWIQSRKQIYAHYREKLSDTKNIQFQKLIASKYNYIYMPVCFENADTRNRIHLELLKHGIRSRKYFWPLTADCPYFSRKGANLVEKFDLEKASEISGRVLCLPLYPDLEMSAVDNTVSIVQKQVS